MSAFLNALVSRMKRLEERLVVPNSRLPCRFLSDDGQMLYETPGYGNNPYVAWKVYIGLDPNEDGCEP